MRSQNPVTSRRGFDYENPETGKDALKTHCIFHAHALIVTKFISPWRKTNHVLTGCTHGANRLFVVVRGKKIQLVEIPKDIILSICTGGYGVLEIKESGGYKVPIWRDGTDRELIAIDNYTDPESVIRDR